MMKTLKEIIGEAIGEASMCWNPRPSTQVFNSEEASKIIDKTCRAFAELMEEMVGEDEIKLRFLKYPCEKQFNCGYNVAKAEIRERIKKMLEI